MKGGIFLSKEVLEKNLDELENAYFMLQMCDHWDKEDYRYAEELREKIKELKGKSNE